MHHRKVQNLYYNNMFVFKNVMFNSSKLTSISLFLNYTKTLFHFAKHLGTVSLCIYFDLYVYTIALCFSMA
jgi:hypothetical protein